MRQPVFVGIGLREQDKQDEHNDSDVRVYAVNSTGAAGATGKKLYGI